MCGQWRKPYTKILKSNRMNKNPQYIDEEHPDFSIILRGLAKEAGMNARKETFDAGLSVMVMREGKLYYDHPDGTTTPVKQ